MFNRNTLRLRFVGKLLLVASAALAGCGHAPSAPVVPAARAAQIQATPTVAPTATPRPTPRPHTPGVALFRVFTKAKVFALTFDDGPDPTYTPQVLAILKAKKAPATFFMVGKMVRAHASTARLVKAAGFPIGNHSWSHPMHPKNPVGEIDRTDKILKSTLGITPVLFRPPYGITTNGLAKEASRRGEDVILWTSVANDWDKKNSADQLERNVLSRAAPGGIALMHDGGGNRARTVAALPGLIDTLRQRGYTLVTVPQLLAMGKPEIAALGVSHIKRLQGKKAVTKIKAQAAKTAHAFAPKTPVSPAKTPVAVRK